MASRSEFTIAQLYRYSGIGRPRLPSAIVIRSIPTSLENHSMRRPYVSLLAAGAIIAIPHIASAQDVTEASRKVAGGGVSVAGWTGKIDDKEAASGATLNDAKLAGNEKMLSVTTGPATTYWNSAHKASGNYTVKATFNEPKFQNLSPHPHPYGIVIAGNDLGTGTQSYLYCAAYGNGNFIVRGMGPAPFMMNGGRGGSNDAVHKASAIGQPVTQEIAMVVKDGKVDCVINGVSVASYDKAALVTDGKLKSLDGVYGVRFAHNTEATVSNLTMTKN